MKEVPYNGDLHTDIDTLNRDYNVKKDFAFKFGISFISAAIIEGIAFKCGVPLTTELLLPLGGATLGYSAISSTIGTFISNKKHKKELRKANHNTTILCSDLAKEDTIIDKDAFEDAEIIKEVTKSTTKTDEGTILSKEEKVIKYFYLLDNNDQVAVLKQIRKTVKEQGSTSTNTKLELLEEEDLKDKELPVRKTLIRK